MPQIERLFTLDVPPQRYVDACSPEELEELQLLLSKDVYQLKIQGEDALEIEQWKRRFEGATVEETLQASDEIDADFHTPGQHKANKLLGMAAHLAEYTGEAAEQAREQILKLAKKWKR